MTRTGWRRSSAASPPGYGVYACYGNHDIQEKILAGFTFGGKDGKKRERSQDG